MLYNFHEMQHAALAPWRMVANANQRMLSTPFNPLSYTRSGKAIAAACEIFSDTTKRRGRPEFDILDVEVDGKIQVITEESVLEHPFCSLKRFHRSPGPVGRTDPKLLIVAPMSGHFATLLRGTVQQMVKNHDVYITDWRDARDVPLTEGAFDLDDYVDEIMSFLKFLGPNTHILAVCQPSVPVLAATAIMNEDDDDCLPASITLMGGPIDTRINPTEVNNLATTKPLDWFERNVITHVPMIYPGAFRRVYPGFLQLSGFMTMNLDTHIGAHVKMYNHLINGDGDSAAQHRAFYAEYMAVMDMPSEYYLDTIKTVFQDHALPKGTMMWRDRKVDTSAIRKTAIMTVEGELDDISGVGQTKATHDICPNVPKSRRAHYEQKGVGHYGVFNGRRWREKISPKVSQFILKHNKTT
jgi:poly(3-hydroxybutyrate) depolymerase